MASDGEKQFQPIRSQNILDNENSHEHEHGYPDDEVEKPVMVPTDSWTDVDERPGLERSQTSKSARDRRQFEPIISGDREQLHRIASEFGGSVAVSRTLSRTLSRPQTAETGGLERRDTLAG